MPSATRILALDPAFRHTGYAILELGIDSERVVNLGVISTKKADRKQKIFASDDNHRCSQEIAKALTGLVAKWTPDLVVAESQTGSKSSRAAQLQGMAWGIVSALTCFHRISILQATPKLIKELTVGSKTASKDDIEAAVKLRYPEAEKLAESIKPPSAREHAYDAISVAVACLESTEITTLRRLAVRAV